MQTNCTIPNCINNGKYCRIHPVKKVKVFKPIAPLSKKRVKLQREYRKIVAEMLQEDFVCDIKSPVCKWYAGGLNHIQKRTPKNLILRSNLERACNECNGYIETHTEWAKENGHFISKHEKTD